eukprot:scaffold7570_cov430-Prasinococcus_capsulatus_cf.AAC.4
MASLEGGALVVIDAKAHMLGRLASLVAKQLLNGQKVVVVRCEDLVLSGGFVRQKEKFCRYIRKRMNTNPRKGPFHFRAPSKIFYKAVKGMVPHKTKRGTAALERLKVFEGIPEDYQKTKRMVCPDALQVLRLLPGHKYVTLARLASEMGWNYMENVQDLEAKRKVASAEYYKAKKAQMKARAAAAASVDA